MDRENNLFVKAAMFLLCWGLFPSPAAFAGPSFAGSCQDLAQYSRAYEDYAQFIAGISNRQSTLASYESRPTWIKYAKWSEETWKRFEERQVVPMTKWSSEELKPTFSSGEALFYPFSGPDFVNMYTLFPHARAYLMVALDPVGELPDFATFEEKDFQAFFAGLQRSLYDLLHLDFFITEELEIDLSAKELKGTLPIILFFMAREGVRVRDVQRWFMKPDGAILQVSALDRRHVEGVHLSGLRIVFERDEPECQQILYYFRFNLDNNSFKRNAHFVTFLKGFGRMTTFVKAASYLMFNPGFSKIRQFILDRSHYILQTTSGIPFKDFNPSIWNIRLYGVYKGPIPVFKHRYQADLVRAYREGKEVKPLPFGIGYHFQVDTSNLIFASRKEQQSSSAD